jgi:hypothetical protein
MFKYKKIIFSKFQQNPQHKTILEKTKKKTGRKPRTIKNKGKPSPNHC